MAQTQSRKEEAKRLRSAPAAAMSEGGGHSRLPQQDQRRKLGSLCGWDRYHFVGRSYHTDERSGETPGAPAAGAAVSLREVWAEVVGRVEEPPAVVSDETRGKGAGAAMTVRTNGGSIEYCC